MWKYVCDARTRDYRLLPPGTRRHSPNDQGEAVLHFIKTTTASRKCRHRHLRNLQMQRQREIRRQPSRNHLERTNTHNTMTKTSAAAPDTDLNPRKRKTKLPIFRSTNNIGCPNTLTCHPTTPTGGPIRPQWVSVETWHYARRKMKKNARLACSEMREDKTYGKMKKSPTKGQSPRKPEPSLPNKKVSGFRSASLSLSCHRPPHDKIRDLKTKKHCQKPPAEALNLGARSNPSPNYFGGILCKSCTGFHTCNYENLSIGLGKQNKKSVVHFYSEK